MVTRSPRASAPSSWRSAAASPCPSSRTTSPRRRRRRSTSGSSARRSRPSGCSDPPLTPDQLPQPTRVDNRKGDASGDRGRGAGRRRDARRRPRRRAGHDEAARPPRSRPPPPAADPAVEHRRRQGRRGHRDRRRRGPPGPRHGRGRPRRSPASCSCRACAGRRSTAPARSRRPRRPSTSAPPGSLGVPIPLESLAGRARTSINTALAADRHLDRRAPRSSGSRSRPTSCASPRCASPAGLARRQDRARARSSTLTREQREQMFDRAVRGDLRRRRRRCSSATSAVSVASGTGFLTIEHRRRRGDLRRVRAREPVRRRADRPTGPSSRRVRAASRPPAARRRRRPPPRRARYAPAPRPAASRSPTSVRSRSSARPCTRSSGPTAPRARWRRSGSLGLARHDRHGRRSTGATSADASRPPRRRLGGCRVNDRFGRLNLRVARSYGPLLAVALAFLLMAVVVPTADREPPRPTPATSRCPTFADRRRRPAPAGRGGTDGRPAPAARAAPAATAGTGGTAAAPQGGGAARAPTARCRCPATRTRRRAIAFSGDNGGATYQGVTDDEIVVAVRELEGPSAAEIFADISGEQRERLAGGVSTTPSSALGRVLLDPLPVLRPQDPLSSSTGPGQRRVRAARRRQGEGAGRRRARPPKEIGAFADISGITIPYADALARQGVVNIGAPYPSQQVVRATAARTRGASSPTAPTSWSRRRPTGSRRLPAGLDGRVRRARRSRASPGCTAIVAPGEPRVPGVGRTPSSRKVAGRRHPDRART